MAKILNINGSEVKIGEDDGGVVTVPLAALQFANPREGDEVEVYRDGKDFIIRKASSSDNACADGDGKSINKHVFVWVGTFLFGSIGVDRFLRGQIGLGVFKLLLNTLGWIIIVGGFAGWIWSLVDWITALTKAYGSAYGSDENITFDANGQYTK